MTAPLPRQGRARDARASGMPENAVGANGGASGTASVRHPGSESAAPGPGRRTPAAVGLVPESSVLRNAIGRPGASGAVTGEGGRGGSLLAAVVGWLPAIAGVAVEIALAVAVVWAVGGLS